MITLKTKKAQQNIIITVLLVLIAISAIVLVSTFVVNMIKVKVQEGEVMSKTYNLDVTSTQLIDSLYYKIYIQRRGPNEPLGGVKIVLTDSSGNSKTYSDYTSISVPETKPVTVPAELKNIAKVEVYPIVNYSGRQVLGNIAGSMSLSSSGTSSGSYSGNTGTLQTSSNNLVAYYPFEGNANDASGNGFNGACSSPKCPTLVPGRIGQAYSFDGIDDIINIVDAPALRLNESLTISAWINPKITARTEVIWKNYLYEFDLATELNGFHWWHGNSSGTGVGLDTLNSKNNFTIDKWTHIAVSRDGNSRIVNFYVNGTKVYTVSYSSTNSPKTSTNPIQIGSRNGVQNFTGMIDEVRIYNRSLSATEIASLYAFESS
jgi:hypothetical protein